MDCSKCNLRYNTATRKPMVIPCGHTYCEPCSFKILFCPICNELVDKSKSTFNLALLDMLNEKRVSKDLDKLIKVCFVGESKVGKTSLINRLRGE